MHFTPASLVLNVHLLHVVCFPRGGLGLDWLVWY